MKIFCKKFLLNEFLYKILKNVYKIAKKSCQMAQKIMLSLLDGIKSVEITLIKE